MVLSAISICDVALLLDQQVLEVDLDPLQQCAKLTQDHLSR